MREDFLVELLLLELELVHLFVFSHLPFLEIVEKLGKGFFRCASFDGLLGHLRVWLERRSEVFRVSFHFCLDLTFTENV